MAQPSKLPHKTQVPAAFAAGNFFPGTQEPTEIRTRQWMHFAGLLALTIISTVLCYFMIEPFLAPITSAIALAVVMVPMQRALERNRWRPSLAAITTVVFTLIMLALPLFLVGERLVIEIINTAAAIDVFFRTGAWQAFLDTHPWLERAARWIAVQTDLPAIATSFSGWATGAATSVLRASGSQIVATIVTFYMLFFALRDRRLALSFLTRFSPLSGIDMTGLNHEIAETIRATLLGTVMVAIIQGTLGGLMFWMLGLPSPLLWGLIMGLAAIVPVLGTFLVWIPAAAFLFLTGNTWQAVVLVAWGIVVVGSIDNLLYPLLVGNRLQTHTIPTFLSLVGGLFLFGPAGIVIGPVVFTVTIFLLDHWHDQPLPIPASETA